MTVYYQAYPGSGPVVATLIPHVVFFAVTLVQQMQVCVAAPRVGEVTIRVINASLPARLIGLRAAPFSFVEVVILVPNGRVVEISAD